MEFDKLVAVSGLSGVFQIVTNRNNGLIIEDIDSGKRKFAPARKHQFTPLASIGIYTDDGDTKELKGVFQTMLEKLEEVPLVSGNDSPDKIQAYFAQILPNYDRDQVYLSDMKKVIKWFSFLHERNMINDLLADEEE